MKSHILVGFSAAIFLCSLCSARGQAVCSRPQRSEIDVAYGREPCDPRPLIFENAGCKECMFVDAQNVRRIGIGYDLMNPESKQLLQSLGADYDSIFNGASTAFKSTCDCRQVTCLNQTQILGILDYSVKTASQRAAQFIPTFAGLCCDVQNPVVDISFAFESYFTSLTNFKYWLSLSNWKAAADDLSTSNWCVSESPSRCGTDVEMVQKGCGCEAPVPQSCDPEASACCSSNNTCCEGAFTFNEHEEKTFDEMWCCPLQDAVCCTDISCCFPNYPVCCPGNTCCATEYPVCCPNHVCCSVDNPQCCGKTCCPQSMRCVHGQCVQKDGTVAPGVPATPKVYGLTPEHDKVTRV